MGAASSRTDHDQPSVRRSAAAVRHLPGPAARPALAHGLVERFTVVDAAAYDDIRAMPATIRAAGWTSLAQAASHSSPARIS